LLDVCAQLTVTRQCSVSDELVIPVEVKICTNDSSSCAATVVSGSADTCWQTTNSQLDGRSVYLGGGKKVSEVA